jgi:deazaflavin-dependent oxidoreductase (nitroreductase family)
MSPRTAAPSKVTVRLTTTGARSGKARTVTLYAYPDDDRFVVVGSRGGAARHPAWVHNLRADGRASLQVGSSARRVVASEAIGSERERLWQQVTAAFPLYAAYQRRTKRTIPLFVLEPVAQDA